VNKNIYLKNTINPGYFNKSIYLKNKIKINKIINNIFISIDSKRDAFHTLSNKFDFNFKYAQLAKFNKYKSIIIIGMGGSVLGSKAIYSFCNDKIKKKLVFFDNLDQLKIEKIKKQINLKIAFLLSSQSQEILLKR
jgi:glucose-6-phosphate isomerase